MTQRMTESMANADTARDVLRAFRADDVASLVAFWNDAFCDQRNFTPLTIDRFTQRVLACPAFEPGGLILAWHHAPNAQPQLVGLVHALKPPPMTGLYGKWEPRHHIAVLYVAPEFRRRGIGRRLLQAAENWLYYCPVHIAGQLTPCYGSIEGPRAPFFGSTERMGIPATARGLIHFFAAHGYSVDDPGDVSMSLALDGRWPRPPAFALHKFGLSTVAVDNAHPFTGMEPEGREEYSLWGDNDGDPYGGLVLVDDNQRMHAHMSWYPLADGATMALGNYWVAPPLRGQGIGSYLLDAGLHAMSAALPARIELHTHLVHHARAVAMYERRGFLVDMAWVNLVKT